MATGPIHIEVVPRDTASARMNRWSLAALQVALRLEMTQSGELHFVGDLPLFQPGRQSPFPLQGFRGRAPVPLQAPQFGVPDPQLARMVCASIETVMPPTPWRAARSERVPDIVIGAAGWALVAVVLCGAVSAAVRL